MSQTGEASAQHDCQQKAAIFCITTNGVRPGKPYGLMKDIVKAGITCACIHM